MGINQFAIKSDARHSKVTKNSLIKTRTHRSATRRLGGAERTWRRAEKFDSPAVANNIIRVCVLAKCSGGAFGTTRHRLHREGRAGRERRTGGGGEKGCGEKWRKCTLALRLSTFVRAYFGKCLGGHDALRDAGGRRRE